MADSRMERRLGELGVRRAFGAPKGALIGQVLMENFLYTLLGGLVGLLFSFLLVTFASSWVFKIGNGFSDAPRMVWTYRSPWGCCSTRGSS